ADCGLALREDSDAGAGTTAGFSLRRFPTTGSLPPAIGHALSRFVFRRWRREEQQYGAEVNGSRNLVESYHARALSRPFAYDAVSLLGRGPPSARRPAHLLRTIRSYALGPLGFLPLAP